MTLAFQIQPKLTLKTAIEISLIFCIHESSIPTIRLDKSISVQQLFIIDKMDQSEKCCQCFLGFTVSRLPRLLNCDHNICETCLQEIRRQEQKVLMCEFCQKTLQIADAEELPYNQNIRLQLQEEKNIDNGDIFPQIKQEEGESLLQDTTNPIGSSISHYDPSQPEEICKIHHVTMDIICLTQKKKICPHCALFGAHKHHVFKRIQDFTKQISQKQHLFKEILLEKDHHSGLTTFIDIQQVIRTKISEKKDTLIKQLDASFSRIFESLKEKQMQMQQQIQIYFQQLHVGLGQNPVIEQYKESREKFQAWEKLCWKDIQIIQSMKSVEDKVSVYFNGPLEIISEGYIYLQKYNRCQNLLFKKIAEAVSVRLQIDNECIKLIEKAIGLAKPGVSPSSSRVKNSQDLNEANPFLDCTSSEICMPPPSLPHNNGSIEAQISSLTSSIQLNHNQLPEKKNFSPLKPFASVQSIQTAVKGQIYPYKRRTVTVTGTKNNPLKDIRASQNFNSRSSQKLQKTAPTKAIVLQSEQKHYDLKEPQKIFTDFKKNTLTDFFDLSGCNLPSDKVVEFVGLARKSHKIKGLKLCTNNLDSAGFQKMIDSLKGVANINLANNQIKESIFEVILRNKQKLDMLRVLNLSHNPLALQRKSKVKMEQVKKMGIIVII